MILRKSYRLFQPFVPVCVILLLTLLSISKTSNANEGNHTARIDTKTECRAIKIGVLAKRGVERCQDKWGPTADYLADKIPGYSFTIVPLPYDRIYSTVEHGEIDFILTNPSFYVELEYLYGTSRMVTLNNLHMGEEFTVYGGVIFCRADRKDLKHLEDIKGRTFMAVEETSLGGWLTAWRELKEHGIDPHEDFASLSYGGTHDAVIYAVRDGKVDVGSVRSDVLEQMAEERSIRFEDFYVFSHDCTQKVAGEFPFVRSTHTYPEWPLAKIKHTSEELAKEVTIALLEMSSDDPAAKAARCIGWIVPQQYQSVRECLKYLRVGRYEDYGKVTFQAVLKQYWLQLAYAFATVCLIILFAFRTVRLNRRLKESEEYTRLMLDSVHVGIVLIDAETHTIIDVNPLAGKMIGVPKEEMIGKICHKFICPAERGQCPITDLGQVVDNSERILIRADGTSMPILKTVVPITVNGRKCLIDSFVDITDRKQAEETLCESESMYRRTIENASGVPYQLDLVSSKYLFVGTGIKDLVGIAQEEFSPQAYNKMIMERVLMGPDVLEDHVTYGDAFRRGEVAQYKADVRIQTSSGNIKWISDYAVPIHDDSDQVVGSLGILLDITERKQAEELLRESEEKVRTLYNSSSDSIMLLDEGGFFDCNDATLQLFGCASREEFCNRHPADFSPPTQPDGTDSMSYARDNIAVALKDGDNRFEHLHRRLDGSDFPAEVLLNAMVLGGKKVLQARVYDITDRKRAEEALKESEERFRRIADAVTGYIYTVRIDNGQPVETVHSCACEAVTGYTSEEFRDDPYLWVQMIPPEDHDLIRDQVSCLLSNNDPKPIEHHLVCKDGSIRWVTSSLVANRDTNGNLLSYDGLISDITDRKRAEEEIHKFKTIADNASYGVAIIDIDGKIAYINECFAQMHNYKVEELLGQNLSIFHNEKQMEDVQNINEELRNSGSYSAREVWHIRRDGSVFPTLMNGVAINDENGKIMFMAGMATDITETKCLQALESRAERLKMAGTIAGQVAHDFNNLLAPIMVYPDFIREELPHDHKARAYLDDIENAAKKIANINQDLLTMGRRGHYNQKVTDLNRIVLYAAKEMESRTNTVTCEMDLCEDLMNIKGGEAQIHRMLTNLLMNAEDAMRGIGQVSIKTENYYADDTSVAYGRVPKGEYVKLTISDTGCGIPDDIIQKILDPFFSTKTTDKKRGSGLGLSVVDAVIKDHNGYMDMSSKVGHGTSFYLYFPITREDADEGKSEQVPSGAETVLVIDDDDIQRDVSTRLLEKLGYKASSVESGEKAIDFLKENPQELVIIDMIMPGGIDGTETYQRIIEISPNQKAIILSGFAESDRVFEAQKLGAGAFVKKPVTRITIAAAVRTELDRKVEVVTS